MLHLAYNLQSLFGQVRSFAFVSDVVEVSAQFEQQGIDEAIGAVFNGGLLDTDADSNYGHARGQVHQRYLGAVTQQTAVILLGDGRGNRNPPQVWALEGIRRRAKQLIWLSPESRGSWKLGSCDMSVSYTHLDVYKRQDHHSLRHYHQQQHPRSERCAQAPLSASVYRLSRRAAGAGDRADESPGASGNPGRASGRGDPSFAFAGFAQSAQHQ